MQNYQRFGSDYGKGVSGAVQPGDYKVPSKDANNLIDYDLMNKPSLFAYTRRAKYDDPSKTQKLLSNAGQEALGNTTKHWKTNQVATNETQMSSHLTVSERPVWSYPRQAYSSKRGYFQTEFQKSLGTHGHNPRNKLPGDAEMIGNENHELTVGTTKTTTHIPGYNGFIPKAGFNDLATAQASTLGARETIVKQNMIENYSVKIPGYKGHKPANACNEKGTIRPNCLNTAGEQF